MPTRHRIALLTAGILVGAQISVASIGTPFADTSEQMEPAPGEVQAEETGTPGERTEDLSEAPAAPVESAQTLIAEAVGPILPQRQNVPQGTAFPPSTDDNPMLPSLVAYLDSTEHLRVTGASGDVFPSSQDEPRMLPALIAYLEQREARLIAAEKQSQVASEVPATGASLAATSRTDVTIPVVQEPAHDTSVVDALSRPNLGNPL